MAQFTQSQLERIKRELKIKELAEGAGCELKAKNGQFVMRCLWHEDHEPSLFIHPEKNLFNCFGCDAGGDVIAWIMKREKIEFTNAVEFILESFPHLKEEETSSGCPLDVSISDHRLLHQVIEFYHQKLIENQGAQDYLRARGIADAEAIKTFKLGWADRDLGRVIPSNQIKAGATLRSRLTKLGIYREKSGHGHFNGCVVFPVIDTQNRVREIYGRKITRSLRKGTALHLYLPEAARLVDGRGIWNERAFSVHSEIILCESIIDAMSFWCAGYRNVTCSYGVENLSDEMLKTFRTHKTKKILLAYDRDESGNAAAERHAKRFIELEMTVYRITFPAGMDANEYALQVTPASQSLGLVIRSAEWMGGTPEKNDPIENAQIRMTNDQEEEAAKEETASPLSSLAASPVPAENQTPLIEANVKDQEIGFTFGERAYRVRGMEKNNSYDQLKINLLVRRGEAFHVDTFDLYQSRPRASFIKQTSIELSLEEPIIKRDLGNVLLKLEQLQDEQIQATLSPSDKPIVEISAEEQASAMELLADENLLDRILVDFTACGVVGEENNKLLGYLAAISRKLCDPLAVLIQSSSAAGKSSLMDAILSFVPEEDKVIYSAMTGQSLYYMGGGDLKHKILAISEEEGVRQASYALKLLQSEGSLRIASTGKDPSTGRMETQEYTVEGPVMLFLTTTSYEIDEELQNRCLTLSVCEDRQQTEAIHEVQRQRQTITGLLSNQDRTAIQTLHQNAQRLLKPLLVANNFAEELTFRSDRTRTRRDHAKYLTLIRTIALLHQHQRDIKTIEHHEQTIEYIEVTQADIEKAEALVSEVMARSYQELPDKTEQLLIALVEMVHTACLDSHILPKEYRFTRKMVRSFLAEHQMAMSATHLKRHLSLLEEAEYLIIHTGGGRGRLKTYQLDYAAPTMQEVHETEQKSTSSPQEGQDFLNRLSSTNSRLSWPDSQEVPKNRNGHKRDTKKLTS